MMPCVLRRGCPPTAEARRPSVPYFLGPRSTFAALLPRTAPDYIISPEGKVAGLVSRYRFNGSLFVLG